MKRSRRRRPTTTKTTNSFGISLLGGSNSSVSEPACRIDARNDRGRSSDFASCSIANHPFPFLFVPLLGYALRATFYSLASKFTSVIF